MSKGMGNPAALIAASEIAKTDIGKTTINTASKGVKNLLVIAGIFGSLYFGNIQYKKYKRRKYLDNYGHLIPAQVAMMSHNAMFSSTANILGFQITIPDGTDETVLNNMALQARGQFPEIAKAYKIIFDRNLSLDIQSELSSTELQAFFARINTNGSDTTTPADSLVPYLKGETVFIRSDIPVSSRSGEKQSNGAWLISNDTQGTFYFGQEVGIIYDIVFHADGEIDYIIDEGFFSFGYPVINHRDLLNRNPEN